jgi:UDP-N-acetyl-D-galactosamine dehydrogenase
MTKKTSLDKAVVCVIGLGYTGLPLALGFAKHFKAIGVDVNKEKVKALQAQHIKSGLLITDNMAEIKQADFIIICVPTPITKTNQPDMTYVKSAAKVAGQNLKKGATVILESTVYPGVTEDVMAPVLEKESGLTCGKDFYVGYSPERINPGDDEHTVERVIKVISGMNEEVTETIAQLYGKVTPRIFKAASIKTAEAAKVTENTQRDLNIALTNELAILFEKLGINSADVFEAAGTKWNFHRYKPGMVGGYCIPVVPYFLVHKAKEAGYHPQVILAGREINDAMPGYIAEMTAQGLKEQKKTVKGARVLVMGLTYKENVGESRNAPSLYLVEELTKRGMAVSAYEPLLGEDVVKNEFKAEPVKSLKSLKKDPVDAVIITVPHAEFLKLGLEDIKAIQKKAPVLVDVPGIFKKLEAVNAGFLYRTL